MNKCSKATERKRGGRARVRITAEWREREDDREAERGRTKGRRAERGETVRRKQDAVLKRERQVGGDAESRMLMGRRRTCAA